VKLCRGGGLDFDGASKGDGHEDKHGAMYQDTPCR
jgi:hypothetical protein